MELSPELLAQLQQAIQNGTLNLTGLDASGRSAVKPRQLHNLTLLPTATDARPTFFFSAESPRDARDLTKTTEYPKLMWDPRTGQDITVLSAESQAQKAAQGYTLQAPSQAVADPMSAIQAQWDALSEADQALLIESQKQDRIAQLKAKLSALPADQLDSLLAQHAADEPRRGPGRPRKDASA